MTHKISSQLIADYQRARARAHRFLRDSCPPLTKKGLAARLSLNVSAFNQFVNGTVFVGNHGGRVSPSQWETASDIRFGTNWTSQRLARFIERVETECWNLGISHGFNSNVKSAAKDDIEELRLDKYWQFLNDIKDAAELNVASALMLWNVCAQEATDARENLRPTMSVNALRILADIVDRKCDQGFACVGLKDTPQRDRLELTANAVEDLIEQVHACTGYPCTDSFESKHYECFHKSLGYGGYDEFFLGLALEDEELIEMGVQRMHESVMTHHQVTDGHVANTATATEVALELAHPKSEEWAHRFGSLIKERLQVTPNDPACGRLSDMQIPKVRALWSPAGAVTKVMAAFLLAVIVLGDATYAADEHVGAEGSRTQVPPTLNPTCQTGDAGSLCVDGRDFDPLGPVPGDVNGDGEFNSADMLKVWQVGEYEDDYVANSTWMDGDWNSDQEFDSSDLALAFKGMSATEVSIIREAIPVPEPTSLGLLTLGFFAFVLRRCRG